MVDGTFPYVSDLDFYIYMTFHTRRQCYNILMDAFLLLVLPSLKKNYLYFFFTFCVTFDCISLDGGVRWLLVGGRFSKILKTLYNYFYKSALINLLKF